MKTEIFSKGELDYLEGRNSNRIYKQHIERKAKQLYKRIVTDLKAFDLLFPLGCDPIRMLKKIKLNLNENDAKTVLMYLAERHVRMNLKDCRYRDCLLEAGNNLKTARKGWAKQYKKVKFEVRKLLNQHDHSSSQNKTYSYGEISRKLNSMQNDMGNRILVVIYELSSEDVDKYDGLAPHIKLTASRIGVKLGYTERYTTKFLEKLVRLGLVKKKEFPTIKPIYIITKLGMRFSGRYLIVRKSSN